MPKSELGTLQTDSLFLGLTRPALIGGVTFTFFTLNGMLCLVGFIVTSDFKSWLFGVVMHIFGMLLCKKEPLAIDILMVKLSKCPSVRNKNFHGGLNSYGLFN